MPNTSHVQTAVINGVDVVPVTVEVAIGEHMPDFQILGVKRELADELRVVVRCAIKATGFEWPNRDVTVSLSPLDMPKRGAHLALPIAAAILAATGQVKLPPRVFMAGELSLKGQTLQDTPGIVAYARYADTCSLRAIIPCFDRLPHDLTGCAVGISSLSDLRTNTRFPIKPIEIEDPPKRNPAFGAIVDAIHGGKSVLVVGPRTRTDTVLTDVPAMLEPLSYDDALELAAIYSIAEPSLIPPTLGMQRPVRQPDSSISLSALIGGGMPIRPGEITLAHHGVLVLDSLGEWKPGTLRQIDAARRDGHVRIVRQDGVTVMPSAFQLVAAMPPCPCGHYGDAEHACTCEAQQVAAWQRRIEGLTHMFDEVIHD